MYRVEETLLFFSVLKRPISLLFCGATSGLNCSIDTLDTSDHRQKGEYEDTTYNTVSSQEHNLHSIQRGWRDFHWTAQF